ncbi:GNAT family N-acetyltransferase [Arthrobacter sp. TE12232]
MSLIVEASPTARQAGEAAAAAASRAGVRVIDEHDRDKLRDVEGLLIAIWGMSPHGAPVPFDLLRSISHAGCNVSAAYNADGALRGAAVGIVSPGGAATYSLIAGVLPGAADKGVGFALKQHQRAWSLARGIETMTWTFDPLVSRNARFNLTKLGAHAFEYARDFYGEMQDDINANDESDRLVAVWPLSSRRSISCSEGSVEELELPETALNNILEYGPDSRPVLLETPDTLWCRAPQDIVALRAADSDEAGLWRLRIRGIFEPAFASGYNASGVTRTGWYRLTKTNQA